MKREKGTYVVAAVRRIVNIRGNVRLQRSQRAFPYDREVQDHRGGGLVIVGGMK